MSLAGLPLGLLLGLLLGCLLLLLLRRGGGRGDSGGRRGGLRRQSLQDGVHLVRHGLQAELELLLGLHHVGALVSDVLQRGGDVNLLGALGHAVQHHVDEAVRPRAARAVTANTKPVSDRAHDERGGHRASGSANGSPAVDHNGAGATAVRLVHFPATEGKM